MNYAAQLAKKQAAAGRPDSYASLLLEPIADDLGATASYEGWEFDHAAAQRFYVGGLRWFMSATGIEDANAMAAHGPTAVARAGSDTTWTQMPGSGDRWRECSLNQFRYARNGNPLYFQKAALVILACEAAIEDRIAKKLPLRQAVSPADVYSHMSIIPAVWNIDDFDKAFVKSLADIDPEIHNKLRDTANQSAKTFVDHLAAGNTVTARTARAVKQYIDQNMSGVTCGRVRAKPGVKLGRQGATNFEFIDLG